MRALLLLLLAGAAAADHEVVALHCPEQVDYRVVRDLDGDGRTDLILLSGHEAWFWRGRPSGFPEEPDAKRTLPEGAALFDVGLVGGDAEELVVRTAAEYRVVPLGPGKERFLMASLPGLPDRPGNILWRGFFEDFDRDGKTDFVDVGIGGYVVTYGAGDPSRLPARLTEVARTAADAASERHVARYAVGAWTSGHFDGDGRLDFGVLTERGLLVYPGDERGRFDAATGFEIAFEEAEAGDLFFEDLNRDGQTDVLAVERTSGKASFLVAHPERGLRGARRGRLQLPGDVHQPLLDDLDGDSLPDLALPYLPQLTMEDVVRVAARGEVLVKVPIFRNRGGETVFPQRADAQLTIPVRVRLSADASGRLGASGLVIVEHGGDLDGDGRRDLLVTEGTGTLAVHKGVPERIFAAEVAFRIRVPDCAEFDSVKSAAARLNDDGQSDIILHYRGKGRLPDRLYVLLSRKK